MVVERARLAFRPARDGFEAAGPHHHATVIGNVLRIESRVDQDASRAEPAALELALTGANRGEAAVPIQPGATRVRDDGAAVTDLGPLLQVHQNTTLGLEQSWVVDEPLAGTGDLVLRLAVSGQQLVARTDSGLHFRGAGAGAGFRYGEATWVDVEGHRSPVATSFVDGEIVITVPAAVLETTVFPAVLDPLISPEFGVDEPVSGDAPYYAWETQVARAGDVYLVTWVDSNRKNYAKGIYGCRVNALTGELLDPTGFTIVLSDYIGTVGYRPMDVMLTTNGQDFLVVWTEDQQFEYDTDLYARRVLADATVLDGPVLHGGLAIAETANDVRPGSAFFDGTNYWVTWFNGPNFTLNASRLDGETAAIVGTNPPPDGTVLMEEATSPSGVGLATDGTTVLVTNGGRYVRASLDGTLLDSTPQLFNWQPGTTAPIEGATTTAFDGTNYVVVMGPRLFHITPTGTVLEPPDDFNLLPGGIEICAGFRSHGGENFRLVVRNEYSVLLWTRAPAPEFRTYGVVWLEQESVEKDWVRNVRGVRVRSALGSIVGETLISPAGDSTYSTSIASDGTDFLVAWKGLWPNNGGDYDVIGTTFASLDGTVAPLEAFPIGTPSGHAESIALVHNGRHYWAGWSEGQSDDVPILATRIDSTGALLDGPSDTGAFEVATVVQEFGNEVWLNMASNDAGRILAVYRTFDDRPDAQQMRLRARFLDDSPVEIDGGIVYKTPGMDVDAGTDASSLDSGIDGGATIPDAHAAGGAASGGSGGSGAAPVTADASLRGAAGTGGVDSGGIEGGGTGTDASGTGGMGGGVGGASFGSGGGAPGGSPGSGVASSGAAPTSGQSGEGGAAGTPRDAGNGPSDGGCGCRLVRREDRRGSSTLLALMAAAMVVPARRRRRGRISP